MSSLGFKLWLDIIQSIVIIGGIIFAWVTSNSKENKTVIKDHCKRLQSVEKAVERIDTGLKHTTGGQGEIKSIHQRIDELAKEHNNLTGKVDESNKVLGRIHDYLLNQKK